VPERRQERTTEGGIDAAGQQKRLAPLIAELSRAGIRVSLFIEANRKQIEAAKALAAPVVELHTGAYCDAAFAGDEAARLRHLKALQDCAREAAKLGLEVHAGHGLTYDTVGTIAAMPEVMELNIGHFLIGEAIFSGLDSAIRRMRAAMDEARAKAIA
jgi:pyridoxine 5-phosphate synthase